MSERPEDATGAPPALAAAADPEPAALAADAVQEPAVLAEDAVQDPAAPAVDWAPEPAAAVAGAEPAMEAAAANDAGVPEVQPTAPGVPAVEAPEPPDPADWDQALRLAEALIFASDRPITPQRLQPVLPERCEARAVLAALAERRADAPVRLVEVAGGWAFRTAPGLAPHLTRVVEVPRRLPRAAMETLAVIAYHQPVTRAEIEEIRGAALAQTTLESLLEMGLIQPRGRKEVPGRPSLWGTTTKFLEQFGLRSLNELPRREELVNEPTLPFAAPPAAA